MKSGVERGVGAAVLLSLLVACTPGQRRREKLSLYCSAQIEWCEIVKRRFEEQTKIRVSMIRKSSGEMFAQIWAERRNPKGDVWWAGTGDSHIQAAEAGLTEGYRSQRLDDLHAWAVDPARAGTYQTTGIYMGALGIAYNSEWLESRGIAPPRGWKDLLAPHFEDEIMMANPNSSGTAYTALTTFVSLFGEEGAYRYLRSLDQNVSQYTKSGSAPVRSAARGEAGVAIVFMHDAVIQRVSGFPIEIVAPEEGTGFEIGCVSLIKGARHPEPARRFIEWSLRADNQSLGAEVPTFQIPSNKTATVAEQAPRLEQVRLLDIDYARFGKKAERIRLIKKWDEKVRSGG